MSTRYKNGSHYENHPRATELENEPAHAHAVAEQHGKEEHLSGHEHTRQALEHSSASAAHHNPEHDAAVHTTVGHGVPAFGHAEIAELAHELWQKRGSPDGSPEEDWHRAAEQLRSRMPVH